MKEIREEQRQRTSSAQKSKDEPNRASEHRPVPKRKRQGEMTMANYDDIFNASAQKGAEDKRFVSFNKEEWAAQKKQERESALP